MMGGKGVTLNPSTAAEGVGGSTLGAVGTTLGAVGSTLGAVGTTLGAVGTTLGAMVAGPSSSTRAAWTWACRTW